MQNKYEELQLEGLSRYPQRSDFEDREVVAIKAFLGPWPRALEEAGIKPPRDDDRSQRNKEKHIRAKQARIAALRKIEKERKKKTKGNGANEQKTRNFDKPVPALPHLQTKSAPETVGFKGVIL